MKKSIAVKIVGVIYGVTMMVSMSGCDNLQNRADMTNPVKDSDEVVTNDDIINIEGIEENKAYGIDIQINDNVDIKSDKDSEITDAVDKDVEMEKNDITQIIDDSSINNSSFNQEDSATCTHEYVYSSTLKEATDYSAGIKRLECINCGGYKDVEYGLPHEVDTYSGVQVVYGYWDISCENEILRLLNEYRESLGLRKFIASPDIISTAHTRAAEIAYSYRHNHSRPTNEKWRTAYDEDYIRCGENIASGAENAQKVMNGWIESPEHNENMINPKFYHVGIGVFIRIDCEETGEITIPDPKGYSHIDTKYYVQSFS